MSHKRHKKTCQTGKFWAMLMGIGGALTFLAMPLYAAKPIPSPLECSISPDNGTATAGLGITFTGSTSGGAKGGKKYSWDFSDGSGTPSASSSNPVAVTYGTGGTYDVLLHVTDRNNGEAVCSATITVNAATGNAAPVAQNDDYNTQQNTQLSIPAPGVLGNDNDPDGDLIIAVLDAPVTAGTLTLSDDGSFIFNPPMGESGSYSFTYHAYDGVLPSDSAVVNISVTATGVVSINSTSSSSVSVESSSVTEQDFITSSTHQLLAVNDLGMHCGDLDTRISSILPPFNVIHAQVVERGRNGNKPRILNENEAFLTYSAASNADDPILSISPTLAKDSSLYKTNFWDIARQSYNPFYPSGILNVFYPDTVDIVDVGLPVPNVELLYLGEHGLAAGVWLEAGQQAMPGIDNPLLANNPQEFHEHIGIMPFFTTIKNGAGEGFGYTADLNVFEAAGIPMAVYDDSGRANPYPLMRVQATTPADGIVATVDTVVPISGEAECQRCHAAEVDGGNGEATQALIPVSIPPEFLEQDFIATSIDDAASDIPSDASVEWASDKNILKLHDMKHGTVLITGTIEDFPMTGTKEFKATVCQTCHYTPALDLAQLGPLGEENDNDEPVTFQNSALGTITIDSMANGRDQVKHKTMSNVMHSHHGQFTDLFPAMPPAVDIAGDTFDNTDPDNPVYDNNNKRLSSVTKAVLGQTCYACHPGNDTECMRGAMANGGQVCQDCHGDMNQVGDDFSRDVSPTNAGAFHVAGDYYTNPATPRVPWANEPGCGSCHTGNAIDNLAGNADTLANPVDSAGISDGIRLAQAFRIGDIKATPIVPVNMQFAENVVTADDNPDAAGNPKLYRVSTGHGGVFCEGCHGSTHAEWPNANPFSNDNVTANQIQGHSGTIIECQVCHEGEFNIETFKRDMTNKGEMQGPHGMHPVDSAMWNEKHKEVSNMNKDACKACHGADLKGTVLSRTAAEREVRCKSKGGSLPGCAAGQERTIVPQGTMIGCGSCHQQKR